MANRGNKNKMVGKMMNDNTMEKIEALLLTDEVESNKDLPPILYLFSPTAMFYWLLNKNARDYEAELRKGNINKDNAHFYFPLPADAPVPEEIKGTALDPRINTASGHKQLKKEDILLMYSMRAKNPTLRKMFRITATGQYHLYKVKGQVFTSEKDFRVFTDALKQYPQNIRATILNEVGTIKIVKGWDNLSRIALQRFGGKIADGIDVYRVVGEFIGKTYKEEKETQVTQTHTSKETHGR